MAKMSVDYMYFLRLEDGSFNTRCYFISVIIGADQNVCHSWFSYETCKSETYQYLSYITSNET